MILEHLGYRQDHFDLMLESGGILRTWEISDTDFSRPVTARQNFDHRLAYLEHQGEVSGGRGRVRRVEEGTYTVLQESERDLLVDLKGLSRSFMLHLTLESERPGEGAYWRAKACPGTASTDH